MDNQQHLGAGTARPTRRIYIDLVRIFAILLVMFIHSYKCNLLDKWDKNTGESFHSILTFVPNIAVFYLCGLWEQRHKPGAKP